MSRNFDGTDDNISGTLAAAYSTPMSMACWFNTSNRAVAWRLVGLGDSSSSEGNSIGNDEVNFRIRAYSHNGSSLGFATTTSGELVANSTWQHAAAVFTANNDRSAFLNGGNKATNTLNRVVSDVADVCIGATTSATKADFFPGLIAEAAIWNVALTDTEVSSLAKGFSPRLIRPQSLIFYTPLIRDIQDIRGGVALTNTGTTVADHPRLYS